MKKDEDDLQ